jgi:transposase
MRVRQGLRPCRTLTTHLPVLEVSPMADTQLIISSVVYKFIPGFPEFYRVGNDGTAWSRLIKGSCTGRLGGWKQLKSLPRKDGRFQVCLRKNGKSYWRFIHSLVLEAFVGPCPEGMEACHRDDNPSNNCLDNLRWDTHIGNCEDRTRNGLAIGKYQKANGRKIRRAARYDRWEFIRKLRSDGLTYREISEQVKVDLQTVYRVVTHGREPVGKSQLGACNGNAKLVDDDIRKIRQLRADGMTFNAIAERFSVSKALIQKIVSRKKWKHVS